MTPPKNMAVIIDVTGLVAPGRQADPSPTDRDRLKLRVPRTQRCEPLPVSQPPIRPRLPRHGPRRCHRSHQELPMAGRVKEDRSRSL